MKKYILAIDQGTTSSRTIIFDDKGKIVAQAKIPFKQYYPEPGYVEHDPEEIYLTVCQSIQLAMAKENITAAEILAVSITNQRETVVVWDKNTGKPVYPAIVWQCRRTADLCYELVKNGCEDMIRAKTGLVADAYFSGSKIRWILDNVPNVRIRAEKGELLAGTIDAWLLWKLTAGTVHATDYSNAARTMLFNIHSLTWDDELLSMLDIPRCLLPEVKPNAHIFGYVLDENFGDTDWREVPIAGMAGDQQAALFGQACFNIGTIKSTYGTGGFILAQTGKTPVKSQHRLLTTVAWNVGDRVQYALEGSVFNAGSTLQWLKDELGLIQTMDEVEVLARQAGKHGNPVIVPAFTGLGAPYWNMEARGAIFGLTRGVNRAQLCRAALESIAYQVADVYSCISRDCVEAGVWKIGEKRLMRVDGGAAVSDIMLQLQADLIDATVERPQVVETTALGSALMAGLGVGLWQNISEVAKLWHRDIAFVPKCTEAKRNELMHGWHRAVNAVLFTTDE